MKLKDLTAPLCAIHIIFRFVDVVEDKTVDVKKFKFSCDISEYSCSELKPYQDCEICIYCISGTLKILMYSYFDIQTPA